MNNLKLICDLDLDGGKEVEECDALRVAISETVDNRQVLCFESEHDEVYIFKPQAKELIAYLEKFIKD